MRSTITNNLIHDNRRIIIFIHQTRNNLIFTHTEFPAPSHRLIRIRQITPRSSSSHRTEQFRPHTPLDKFHLTDLFIYFLIHPNPPTARRSSREAGPRPRVIAQSVRSRQFLLLHFYGVPHGVGQPAALLPAYHLNRIAAAIGATFFGGWKPFPFDPDLRICILDRIVRSGFY